jgi:PPOX class probable F420-dependent enzyme
MEQIPAEAKHLLEGLNFAHLATLMPDGSPHVSPIWVEEDEGLIVFNTAEGRLKTRNLRRDGRAAISVADPSHPYEHLQIRGRVIEMSHRGADEHVNALARRYLGRDEYPWRRPGEQRVIVRIEPEKVRHANPRRLGD